MSERKKLIPARQWSAHFFQEEEKALPSGSGNRPVKPTLRAGDRVSFDLGKGVDGPDYAMNVRLLDSED